MTFDEAMGHLQTMESHDFNDDEVMESLQSTMTELRRSGLDHPGPSQTTEQAPPPPRDIDELRSRVLFSQRIHDVNYKPSRIKRNESFREGIKAMYDNDDEPITSPNTSEPDNTDDRIYHNVQDNHSTIIPKVPAKSSGSPLRSTSYGLGNPTDANGHVPVSV